MLPMTATMVWDQLKRAVAANDLHLTFAGLAYACDDVAGNPDLVMASIIYDVDGLPSTLDLNPLCDGAVLPILHRRGQLDSETTLRLYAMGHRPVEVVGGDPEQLEGDLSCAVEWAAQEIRALQQDARSEKEHAAQRWPIIVLHTPEEWDVI